MDTLCFVILTMNEEINLPQALSNIKDIANEIVVVDSGSTDKTVEVAESYGARIYVRDFDNYSNQRNFSLKETSIKSDWVFVLDADEYLTDELKSEILTALSSPTKYDAFYIRRRFYWMGTWIKRGYYPTNLLRLGKKEYIACDDRGINEHLICTTDKVGQLKADFVDNNMKGIFDWLDKHNRYSSYEAGRIIDDVDEGYSLFGSQYHRKRWIRVHIWNKLPIFFRPFVYLFYRLIIRLGFLDGPKAIIYHFLHAFLYRFIIDAKLVELRIKILNEKK